MWVVWRTGGVSVSQFSCAPFPSHRNNLILSANLHPADENSSRSTFTQNNHCRTRSDLTENTRTGASVRSACPLLSQNLCRISERLSSAKNAQRLFYGFIGSCERDEYSTVVFWRFEARGGTSVHRVVGVWQQDSGKGPRLGDGAVVFYGCFFVIEAHGGRCFRTPRPIVVRGRPKCQRQRPDPAKRVVLRLSVQRRLMFDWRGTGKGAILIISPCLVLYRGLHIPWILLLATSPRL